MGKQVAAGIIWGCSSVGRAPALQAGGQEFESLHLHSVSKDTKHVPWKLYTEYIYDKFISLEMNLSQDIRGDYP